MGKVRFRRVTRCAFCDNPPNSKEHAWPSWLLEHLKTSHQQVLGFIESAPAPFDPGQRALKVPCVCIPCNTRWMHDLEDETRPLLVPMIDDIPRAMSIPHQWQIALWATKTAMVLEYVSRTRALYYTDEDRRRLHGPLLTTLPSYTAVWLARYDGEAGLLSVGTDGSGSNPSATPAQCYATTMVFGKLAIQVVSLRTDPKAPAGSIHPRPGPWSDGTIRVWPTNRAAAWPPQISFRDSAPRLVELHQRWDNPTMIDGGYSSDDVLPVGGPWP